MEKALELRLSFFSSPEKRVMNLIRRKKDDFSSEEVMSVLWRVDFSNPKQRGRNSFDECFSLLLPVFEKHKEALAYLNKYGWLGEAYLEQYPDAEVCYAFQIKLCESYHSPLTGLYRPCYGNLLCAFLRRYDFLEHVKEKIFSEKCYEGVVALYQRMKEK